MVTINGKEYKIEKVQCSEGGTVPYGGIWGECTLTLKQTAKEHTGKKLLRLTIEYEELEKIDVERHKRIEEEIRTWRVSPKT